MKFIKFSKLIFKYDYIKFVISVLLLIFILSSCNKDDEKEDDKKATVTTTFGIRHDKRLSDYEAVITSGGNDLPNFNAVVFFEYSLDGSNNREFTATGTLIKENWILTAAHNFFVADEQSSPATASGIQVLVGNDPNSPTKTISVEKIELFPTWVSSPNSDFRTANDLCLVKLSSPITDIQPVELFRNNTEAIGSMVWFCGFGDYSKQAGQDPNKISKKHAIANILDRKKEGIETRINNITYTGGLLAMDFDHPDGSINTLGDAVKNADEIFLGDGDSSPTALELEGSTVEGDSGGPLFVKDGNTWKLAGVLFGGAADPIANHKDSSYGDISIFTRVSQHITWIDSVVN